MEINPEVVNNFLSHEEVKDFKFSKIYKEYEFMYEENSTNYHGIIDLMLVYDKCIKIVDYKLKNVVDEAYKVQLNGYKKYIEKKFYKEVYIYLYSILDDEFLEIKLKN
jgi:ATP-dependent exoDNAse (exonuclease V) beta subunit